MRRLAFLALVLAGCIPTRAKLLRALHSELDEVRTSESAEMPYRAHTPDLDPLIGLTRDDIGGELGSGDCDPTEKGGQRCLFRFSTDPGVQSAPPLVLQVEFDKAEKCVAARWRELR